MLARREIFLVALWIGLAFLQSGCLKRFSVTAPSTPSVISRSRYSLVNYKADLKQYNDNLTSNPARAKQMRDKIVYGLMGEIDDAYGQFTKNLYTGKGAFGVGGDSAQLGLTAASTIATHTPTKTILSALATAFTGVNLSIDKNFFAQQTYQTIAVAMQTRRDKAREAITKHLTDEDGVDIYPVESARRDLLSYFYAGTLPGGLQELQEEAGAAAKASSAKTALH